MFDQSFFDTYILVKMNEANAKSMNSMSAIHIAIPIKFVATTSKAICKHVPKTWVFCLFSQNAQSFSETGSFKFEILLCSEIKLYISVAPNKVIPTIPSILAAESILSIVFASTFPILSWFFHTQKSVKYSSELVAPFFKKMSFFMLESRETRELFLWGLYIIDH